MSSVLLISYLYCRMLVRTNKTPGGVTMARGNHPLVTPTGLLDVRAPIIKRFEDGPEVSSWMSVIRNGGTPTVDLLDQLKAAGWEHATVARVDEIVDQRKRQNIGYSAISGLLGRNKGCELEVEVTDTNGRKFQLALRRNEFTLLHGHTINPRGPERRGLLKMSTTPGIFGGMLLAVPVHKRSS